MQLFLQAARSAGVPVILDAGGMDAPIPQELLDFVDILSPNETELGRLTGMSTESFEQISQAVAKCHKLVSFGTTKKNILLGVLLYFAGTSLVTCNSQGSNNLWFVEHLLEVRTLIVLLHFVNEFS